MNPELAAKPRIERHEPEAGVSLRRQSAGAGSATSPSALTPSSAKARCLAALGKPEAEEPLRAARELVASMGFSPAVADVDGLLGSPAAAAP